MPWPRRRFVRDPDGRIVDVRRADDPWFQLDFLRDPDVIAFFRAKDRIWDRAHGFPAPEHDDGDEHQEQIEHRRAAVHARLLARRGRRRS